MNVFSIQKLRSASSSYTNNMPQSSCIFRRNTQSPALLGVGECELDVEKRTELLALFVVEHNHRRIRLLFAGHGRWAPSTGSTDTSNTRRSPLSIEQSEPSVPGSGTPLRLVADSSWA